MKFIYLKCPFCGSEIKDGALKCKFCRETISDEKPKPMVEIETKPDKVFKPYYEADFEPKNHAEALQMPISNLFRAMKKAFFPPDKKYSLKKMLPFAWILIIIAILAYGLMEWIYQLIINR